MKDKSRTVTFRVSTLQWQRLAEAADKHGASPGEWARRAVLESLEMNGRLGQGAEHQLAELEAKLHQLLLALARATLVLLVDAGKCEEANARRWVSERILNHVVDRGD